MIGDIGFLVTLTLLAQPTFSRVLGPLVLALIAVVAWVLTARGKIKFAIDIMSFGVWLGVTGIAIFVGGVHTPIVYAYPLIIIALGFLNSARVAVVMAALTTLLILGLAVAETHGVLPVYVPALPVMYGFVQVTVCVSAALLIAAVVGAYQNRLKDLGGLARRLRIRTLDLEVRKTQLHQAQAVAKVGSWVYDFGSSEIRLTSETRRIFGLPNGKGDGREALLACTYPQDRCAVMAAYDEIRKGTTFDLEHRIVVDGSIRWVRQKAEMRTDAEDAPLWAIGIVQDITERKAAEEQIQSLAFYDPLTQLPNRRLLMDRLKHAIAARARHQRNGALLFVDLDNFKVLNDTHGHFMGDLLLQQVGQRLTDCMREGDSVARLGGDEFVVMLENLSENRAEALAQADVVSKKILAILDEPYQLGTHAHRSTASIGVTLFGDQAESIDEPLKRADMAMYQSKTAGRNRVQFFDPRMYAELTERAALEVGMREALAQDQFVLHYQVQVTSSGQRIGAEALLRWQHPQRGFISPADFIPVAEETGLILPLGYWVLESACKQLAVWAANSAMADLTVAVNVSARQFHQSDFVDQVLMALSRTGASAHRLKLELTEGLLVSNIEDVISKMTSLKGAGVGFSLDDFGTGYSSLSYLKRLPLEQLKIDQSFVRDILIDPNDAAISKMVIVLADSLGLAVIAEGVETEAQRDFLARQGCKTYQGYLFSRPLPAAGFEAYVADRAPVAAH